MTLFSINTLANANTFDLKADNGSACTRSFDPSCKMTIWVRKDSTTGKSKARAFVIVLPPTPCHLILLSLEMRKLAFKVGMRGNKVLQTADKGVAEIQYPEWSHAT